MNKMVVQSKDDPLRKAAVLVLEPGNIKKLTTLGQPIEVDLNELFPDGLPERLSVGITYSDTPVADARATAAMGKVVIDQRTPHIANVRPHCPECGSTIEQLAVMKSDAPVCTIFCPVCGCVLGVVARDAVKDLKAA
jgi:hypothetical protein